jgi:hypothetical protein
VAVLYTRKVAAQQAGAALDVALRQPPLAPIGFDDLADIDLWFLFRHWFLQQKQYLNG